MTIDRIREVVSRLDTSAAALAVIAAAIDAKENDAPLDPTLAPLADGVLSALGLDGAIDGAAPGELRALLTQIRSFSHLNGELLRAEGRRPGWHHTDPDFLHEFASLTRAMPTGLRCKIAPSLDGLAARLDSTDASFLDVGVGVGVLAIEMARTFPSLRIVGIDPWMPALSHARANVTREGLDGRIELREQGGEDLTDEGAFDLAWVASPFIPERVIRRVVERVLGALRPGGWLLFATPKPVVDPLGAAVARFRQRTFGGALLSVSDCEAMLRDIGYAEVRALPGPPEAVAAIVAARRAPG